MHVGFICNEYPAVSSGGGIGIFTQTLARYLINNGFKVTIFGVYKNHRKNKISYDGQIKIISLKYKYIPKIHFELNRWLLMRRIEKEHKINNLDILESPDYQGWLRKSKIDIPIVTRIHNPEKFGFMEQSMNVDKAFLKMIDSEQNSIKNSDYIISCSKSVVKASKKTYSKIDFSKKPIKTIYNFIDTDFFKPTNEKHNSADILVVFAGRISEKKGLFELINAWPSVIKNIKNAKLIIAGRDSFIKGKSMIQMLKKSLPNNIKDSVTFKGFIDSSGILNLFQKADICVLPSHREVFSIVALEAMAVGVPVVYTKIEPAYELIKDNENGLLCNVNDSTDISEKILLLCGNKDLRFKIGNNARKTILDNFSITKLGKKKHRIL